MSDLANFDPSQRLYRSYTSAPMICSTMCHIIDCISARDKTDDTDEQKWKANIDDVGILADLCDHVDLDMFTDSVDVFGREAVDLMIMDHYERDVDVIARMQDIAEAMRQDYQVIDTIRYARKLISDHINDKASYRAFCKGLKGESIK